jgi:hypothetical protein
MARPLSCVYWGDPCNFVNVYGKKCLNFTVSVSTSNSELE